MVSRIPLATLLLSACFACGGSNRKSNDAGSRDAFVGSLADDSGPHSDGSVAPDAGDAQASEEDAVSSCVIGADQSDCRDGLCRIGAGSFVMGSPRDEPFAAATADVQVTVQLTHDFLIGQSEVTLEQWRASGYPDPMPDWRRTGSKTQDTPPPNYSECKDPSCPVVWLNFEDAMAFANKRSEQEGLPPCYALTDCTGTPGRFMRCRNIRVNADSPYACLGYRLPTEAEWEYAARAGTKTTWFTGDISTDLNNSAYCRPDEALERIAWYCANANPTRDYANGGGHPRRVMRKCANAWGLHDTAGNAYEWVNDIFDPEGYGVGPFVDPVFGVVDPRDLNPEHPTFGALGKDPDGYVLYRSQRGGTFDFIAPFAKVSTRGSNGIGAQHSGFRIARTIPSQPQ